MTQTHTPSDIEKALVTAEDLLVQELDLGERDVDLIGLLQNAVLTALEDPAPIIWTRVLL